MWRYKYTYDDELYHYGVPGMKWGHRKARSGGLSGKIRQKQMSNAKNSLSKINSDIRQVDKELKELNGYAKNPSKIGKSKISTSIRNNQIKSLNKTKSKLKIKAEEEKQAIKELRDIEQYQKNKAKKAPKKSSKKTSKKINGRSAVAGGFGWTIGKLGARSIGYDPVTASAIGSVAARNAASRQKMYDDLYKKI